MKKSTMQSDGVKQLSWSKLAKELGVMRDTLAAWRKLDGHPESRDLSEWRAFAMQNDLGHKGPKLGKEGKELRDEKTRHEIELLKAKLDREHRKVIARDEVNKLLLHIATRGRSMLYQFLETEAPPKLDGLSAAQQRPILREMADSICDMMGNVMEDFKSA